VSLCHCTWVSQVADAFFYNNQLTMSVLQKHGMTAQFFQGWMAMLTATKKSGKMVHFKRYAVQFSTVLYCSVLYCTVLY